MQRLLSSLAIAHLSVLSFTVPTRAQDYAKSMEPMLVDGRITDGENKLVGAEVVIFKANEQLESVKTDKGGRFKVKLEMNQDYGMEFRQEGFVAKRIAIDTRMPKPKPGQEFELVPLGPKKVPVVSRETRIGSTGRGRRSA